MPPYLALSHCLQDAWHRGPWELRQVIQPLGALVYSSLKQLQYKPTPKVAVAIDGHAGHDALGTVSLIPLAQISMLFSVAAQGHSWNTCIET